MTSRWHPLSTTGGRDGRTLVGVMVVVPAFAGGHDADQPVVPALITRLVGLIPPKMRQRVDRPGDVPEQ